MFEGDNAKLNSNLSELEGRYSDSKRENEQFKRETVSSQQKINDATNEISRLGNELGSCKQKVSNFEDELESGVRHLKVVQYFYIFTFE